jgi:ornithine cyclodeaminase
MPDLLVLKEPETRALLERSRATILDVVDSGYRRFGRGEAVVPPSVFLRFPDSNRRIIALPALLRGERPSAGVKWVASFPGNLDRNLRRASATMILNCAETGVPLALLSATAISAHRTAASAALAARALGARIDSVGVVGCGPVAWECLEYLRAAFGKAASELRVHDLVPERAARFCADARATGLAADARVFAKPGGLLSSCSTLALCTTATEPHIEEAEFVPGATVLHLSLRDLAPRVVLQHRNIVDDFDHVCRERTSIELARDASGGRDFVAGALHEVLNGTLPARRRDDDVVLFSPFGLGVLDLAVAQWLYEKAMGGELGCTRVAAFTD